MTLYIFAYVSESHVHITIGVSKDCNSTFIQICIAFFVFFSTFIFVMLGAIHLNRDFCAGTIKIKNELAEYFLTIYSNRQFL